MSTDFLITKNNGHKVEEEKYRLGYCYWWGNRYNFRIDKENNKPYWQY